MAKRKAAHHRGAHHQLSAKARAIYNADPDTTCARCHQPRRPGDPWTAGHKTDGAIATSIDDYQPEHRSCGSRAGQALGVARRQRRGFRTTRDW
jgi:L-asparaginase II